MQRMCYLSLEICSADSIFSIKNLESELDNMQGSVQRTHGRR